MGRLIQNVCVVSESQVMHLCELFLVEHSFSRNSVEWVMFRWNCSLWHVQQYVSLLGYSHLEVAHQ